MIQKIDHIGIAVADAEAALKVFRDAVGLELVETEPVPSQKLVSYHLRVGESNLELLHPTEPDSVIARYLAKRGEGIHHIALAVADIEAEVKRMKAGGLQPLGEPSVGAGGKKVQFFHPKTTGGVLLELCQV